MSKQQLKDKDQMTKRNIHDVQQEYKINLEKPFKVSSPGDFSRRILQASDVALVGGPFHYSIRSGWFSTTVSNDESVLIIIIGLLQFKDVILNQVHMAILWMKFLGRWEWEWPIQKSVRDAKRIHLPAITDPVS